MAITAKRAIEAATKAFLEIYQGAPKDVRLEEVQRDSSNWYITLSFLVPVVDQRSDVLKAFVPHAEHERVFKKFQIDADSAEMVGMTIRQV